MDEALQQRVRELAYAVWEREGCPEGASEQHWYMAEQELRAEDQGRVATPATDAATAAVQGPRNAKA